jgi:AhpD family alkylhydroperoxidase
MRIPRKPPQKRPSHDAKTERFKVARWSFCLVAIENYLKTSGLDHRLLTLVKVRVSQINRCAYCLHMHTEEARKLGETPTRLYLLDAWHESNLYSDRERRPWPGLNR